MEIVIVFAMACLLAVAIMAFSVGWTLLLVKVGAIDWLARHLFP